MDRPRLVARLPSLCHPILSADSLVLVDRRSAGPVANGQSKETRLKCRNAWPASTHTRASGTDESSSTSLRPPRLVRSCLAPHGTPTAHIQPAYIGVGAKTTRADQRFSPSKHTSTASRSSASPCTHPCGNLLHISAFLDLPLPQASRRDVRQIRRTTSRGTSMSTTTTDYRRNRALNYLSKDRLPSSTLVTGSIRWRRLDPL
jgi:hypothetical protein